MQDDVESSVNKKLDYDQIEEFGKCNLSQKDMSAILNIPVSQIQRWVENSRSKFYRSYRKGQALSRYAIAQRQIAVATGEAKGNSALLTYLGSVFLGQNIAQKQPEVKEETAEKMLQNVSDAQKEHIFSTLTGVSDTIETIDDESGDDESGIEADKGE